VTQLLSPEDALLVEGLRTGDEAAFAAVMRMYGRGMLRVAEMYVSSRAVAEDVDDDADGCRRLLAGCEGNVHAHARGLR